jgi:hypothetical protein
MLNVGDGAIDVMIRMVKCGLVVVVGVGVGVAAT